MAKTKVRLQPTNVDICTMLKFMFSNTSNHILVWVMYFFIAWSFYAEFLPLKGIIVSPLRLFIFTVVYLCFFIPIPYFALFLKKKFFAQKKYFLFLGVLLLVFVTGSCAFAYIDKLFIPQVAPSWFFTYEHLLSRVPYFIILSLIINWINIRANYHKQRKQQIELEKLKNEAELNMLKAQISPHFLFNALNNLNSLIHSNQDKASDVVVMLSDLLRYVIYDGKKEHVSIHDEVAYLDNYLTLTSMKKRVDGKIIFDKSIQADVQLTPLIFINFVENAIKHGSLDEQGDKLYLQLMATTEKIHFTCINTIRKNQQKDSVKGIGIENVKARLQVFYPKKHALHIEENETTYNVSLTIEQ
jgi:two-component system, LytTR family, sensor kinase